MFLDPLHQRRTVERQCRKSPWPYRIELDADNPRHDYEQPKAGDIGQRGNWAKVNPQGKNRNAPQNPLHRFFGNQQQDKRCTSDEQTIAGRPSFWAPIKYKPC